MCILIKHSAQTSFSDALLRDFFTHNPDGFGIMYGDGKKLHVTKTMGSVEEVIQLYRDIAEGRDCVIHYRMRTHGNTDLDNCHPYRVTDDLWMAHNGVLATGNKSDPTKSDTWHFIENIIKPIAEADIDLIFDADWQAMIGTMIGTNNKFAFAHSDGRIAVINEKSGINYANAWLSNTYAWSAEQFGAVSYAKSYSYPYGSRHNWMTGDDFETGYESAYIGNVKPKKSDVVDLDKLNYNKVLRAAYNSWRRGEPHLIDWVVQAPQKAALLLREWYDYTDDEAIDFTSASPDDAAAWIADLFESESVNQSSLM